MVTMVKAKRVPMETRSARMSRGTKKARMPMTVPVKTVATMGLWVRGLTLACGGKTGGWGVEGGGTLGG